MIEIEKVMRKITIIALALVVSACGQKKDEWVPTTGAKVDLSVSIQSASPATKTYLVQDGDHLYARWSADDRLNLFFDSWEDGAKPALSMPNSSENEDVALFEGMVREILDGSHKVYAYSAVAGFKAAKGERKLNFNIPEVQTSGDGTYDPTVDIVVNRAYHLVVKESKPEAVISDMRFLRPLATVIVKVNNKTSKNLSAEKINKITLQSGANVVLSGNLQWDFDTEAVTPLSGSPTVTANLSKPQAIDGTSFSYMLTCPVTLPQGSTMKVTFETEHYRIVKTSANLAKDFSFPSNKITSLVVNLNEDDTQIQNK